MCPIESCWMSATVCIGRVLYYETSKTRSEKLDFFLWLEADGCARYLHRPTLNRMDFQNVTQLFSFHSFDILFLEGFCRYIFWSLLRNTTTWGCTQLVPCNCCVYPITNDGGCQGRSLAYLSGGLQTISGSFSDQMLLLTLTIRLEVVTWWRKGQRGPDDCSP